MIIEKVTINGFGKLRDFTITPGSGLNIIYGENEAGKSTLQAFIKAMFFGLRGGRAIHGEALPPIKRFRPWKEGDYGGSLEYRLDDGRFFRVERDFARNTVKVYDAAFNDITSEFEPDRECGVRFAVKHLGMNAACFEKTVFIGQLASTVDREGSKELLNRLVNLKSAGFEEVSFRRAEKALQDALKNFVGTGRTSVRPLDKVRERLAELGHVRDALAQRRKALLDVEMERDEALDAKARLESRKRLLEEIREILSLRNEVEKCRKQEIALQEVLEQGANPGGRRAHGRSTAGWKAKIGDVVAIAALALTAAFIYMGIAVRPLWFAGAPASFATAVLSVLYRIRSMRAHMEWLKQESRMKDRLGRASLACGRHLGSPEDAAAALAEIKAEGMELRRQFDKGIREILSKTCADDRAPTEEYQLDKGVPAFELARLEALWEKDFRDTSQQLEKVLYRIHECNALLRERAEDGDRLQRIEEEILDLELKKEQLEDAGFALETALEVLYEAGSELQRDFVPALNEKLGQIIGEITCGKYSDLRADDGLQLKIVPPETGAVTDLPVLSSGTVDQAYLALRLSVSELFEGEGERLPFIMDEVFSQYDDERTAGAFAFLQKRYPGRQVVLLTCKEREVRLAKEVSGTRLNLFCMGRTAEGV